MKLEVDINLACALCVIACTEKRIISLPESVFKRRPSHYNSQCIYQVPETADVEYGSWKSVTC